MEGAPPPTPKKTQTYNTYMYTAYLCWDTVRIFTNQVVCSLPGMGMCVTASHHMGLGMHIYTNEDVFSLPASGTGKGGQLGVIELCTTWYTAYL